jgi:hypothetical protein
VPRSNVAGRIADGRCRIGTEGTTKAVCGQRDRETASTPRHSSTIGSQHIFADNYAGRGRSPPPAEMTLPAQFTFFCGIVVVVKTHETRNTRPTSLGPQSVIDSDRVDAGDFGH